MRTALVTGANRGIGEAVATALHEAGHRVVVTARDAAAAKEAADRIGAGVEAVALDVTEADGAARAHAAVGPVDILVNNAGVLLDQGRPASAVALDLVERTIDVNALGAWRVCQAFLPDMVRAGWGRVVMVSSGTGSFHNGLFGPAPAYSASKVLLNALTVLLADETAGTGVLVNAVNPGLVRTRMRPDAQRDPRTAAADIAWAATLPDDGPTGGFFSRRQPAGW
ncbi:SDR family NAD(P)-dependent oxidoreductase [Actinoplanes sp. N902-109]|uniref:SDR family NAD(P)-dependent oxidoreductase n=1 Tax=Actinoplanes sp. (strain N902-109) TaxID=649831 RepID=UPI00039C8A47|nr:SDR family NAD(P)-dependent oxidoreductase [Actinoplanes sp. N902-109]